MQMPMTDICWWTRHVWGVSLALVVVSVTLITAVPRLELLRLLASSAFLVTSSWVISDVTTLVADAKLYLQGGRTEPPCVHQLRPEAALASGVVTIILYSASVLIGNLHSGDVTVMLIVVAVVLLFLLVSVAFAVVEVRKRLGNPDALTIEELVGSFDGEICKCEQCRAVSGNFSLQFQS